MTLRRSFTHNGNLREMSASHWSDVEMAGAIRMLGRSDLHFEITLVAARDRILTLSQEKEVYRGLLLEIGRMVGVTNLNERLPLAVRDALNASPGVGDVSTELSPLAIGLPELVDMQSHPTVAQTGGYPHIVPHHEFAEPTLAFPTKAEEVTTGVD